ncbi:MAG: FecR domain-containing protein [Bacteroidota bacterium]
MKKEEFLKLLSKKLSGKLSVNERETLNKVIENNRLYREIAAGLDRKLDPAQQENLQDNKLKATWELIDKAEKEGFISRFNYSAPKVTVINPGYFLKIAAIFILFVGAGLFVYRLTEYQTNKNFLVLATTQQKSFKVLEDGTRIWLNKNSSIRYNNAFGKQKRELFLEGEAYFDVARNKDIPMFVHAGGIDIEVKGTAFNVNAYKGDPEVQVALLRGQIEVSNRQDKKDKVVLYPNQKLIFAPGQSNSTDQRFLVLPITSGIADRQTRWTSDTLVFYKEKLKDLAFQLEKKYELKIQIQSERLKEKRFSGTFINETIEQVLAALKLTYPLTYTINGKLVVIKD